MQTPQRINGFSLVELSIVLVILGLLTGGILGGKSLIEAAELRALSNEHQQWQTAVNTFKQKYMALPGDMRNATQFWGRADTGATSGQCANPTSNQGDGKETCNGNGDGIIGEWSDLANYYEVFRFWQHLANAGMIAGQYSGVPGSGGGQHHEDGVNVPASKFSGAGWNVENVDDLGGDALFFAGDYGNYYELGAMTANNCHQSGALTPAETWNLDMKMDDGKPARGMVVAGNWNECSDAASNSDFDADYDLANESTVCFVNFAHAF